MPVYKIKLVHLGNDNVHKEAVEVHAQVPWPHNIVVGAWALLQYGKKAKTEEGTEASRQTALTLQ